MSIITDYRTHKMDVEDKRDIRDNIIREHVVLRTAGRVTWDRLRETPPIPQWNQPHPTEPGFYLDEVRPNHVSRRIWEIECTYTPYKGGQIDPNPLGRKAVITFDTQLVEQPTLFDANGRPTVNTAGEFVEGVVAQIPLVEYSVKKNLPADPDWLQTHLGATNLEPLKIRGLTWAPKTLLLATVSAGEFQIENKTEYCEYSLKILADARTWDIEIWNRGTVELVQVDDPSRIGKKKWIQRSIFIGRGENRVPVEEPYPLDSKGRAIRSWLKPDENPVLPGELIKLRFTVQPPKSFKKLPLV